MWGNGLAGWLGLMQFAGREDGESFLNQLGTEELVR